MDGITTGASRTVNAGGGAREAIAAPRRRRAASSGTIVSIALLSLLASACGGGSGDDPDASREPPSPLEPLPPDDGTASFLPRADVREIDTAYPYRPDGPYADVLKGCALVENAADACPLETLPFVVQEASPPSVASVMERVLVTHDWMGERLETLLRESPPTLVRLFGATTSIVIGSTVRPSNYWPGTGGIQIDPAYLWLSVEDKQTVSIEEDFRSGFGRALAFRYYTAYRRDGRPIGGSFDLENREERTFADTVVPVSRLLYHELAHANDFLPPDSVAFLDVSLAPAFALSEGSSDWLHARLQAQFPPVSALLERLAQVRYRGEEASARDSAVTADVAGAEMANDGTASFYGYSTPAEDFATLFEAAMVKLALDVDSAIAFTDQPADPERFSCEELIVGWGALNRLGDPSVAARALWAVERVLGPDEATGAFILAQSGSERPMTTGVDFCTNIEAGGAAAKRDGFLPSEEPSRGAEHGTWLGGGDPGRNPLAR